MLENVQVNRSSGAGKGGEAKSGVVRGRTIRASALSAAAGFIAGAVFWHLVGFWDFVANTVLQGPAEEVVAMVSPFEAEPASGCTTLTLDRRRGTTAAGDCPASFVVVIARHGPAQRGDKAIQLRGRQVSPAQAIRLVLD